MDRRKALKNVAFLLGTAISSSTIGILFESFEIPEQEKNQVSFSATDEEILGEFADIIIPTTAASQGAKAAGVGTFISMMVRDCYPAKLQELFATGMKDMLAKCQKDFNKNFISMNTEERHQLMTNLTAEAIANDKKPSFFMITRDLTLLGYFTSEIGCTQAREYLPVPGSYDGNVDYKTGQKAWAT
jgi:hypothetical protein